MSWCLRPSSWGFVVLQSSLNFLSWTGPSFVLDCLSYFAQCTCRGCATHCWWQCWEWAPAVLHAVGMTLGRLSLKRTPFLSVSGFSSASFGCMGTHLGTALHVDTTFCPFGLICPVCNLIADAAAQNSYCYCESLKVLWTHDRSCMGAWNWCFQKGMAIYRDYEVIAMFLPWLLCKSLAFRGEGILG